ncbi:DNA-directed RNA polymerase subunit beta' (Fragment) [Seminavis robusta]|uniref:DNA-directed RNA polymerase subunit n=1 Tax=Seminavis robusta TaxID=568900 RepID=A0A9N8DN51_9STRA
MGFFGQEDDDDVPLSSRRKDLLRGDLGPKKISHLQFGLLSADEMQRVSEFQVCSRELFTMPARTPAPGGCLDPRLGVSDKVSTCATCQKKLVDCAGHYGYIRLALPVFHIGFLRHTLYLLQCICKTCSRVLLTEADRSAFLRRMRSPRTDILGKSATFKKVVDKCKKCRNCPYCAALNGTVKKITGAPTLKIVHERFKGRHSEDELEELESELENAMRLNKDIEPIIHKETNPPFEDLLPTRVLELFSAITDDDCEVMWIDPLIGRPENLVLQNLLVPPVPIRPSVAMDVGGGSNEDDLTVKLQEIIDINVALEIALTKGPHTRTIMEEWDFLQMQVAGYINGELPGVQRPIGAKPMRGLCQRLKGKQGRFRGNLSGKRVDFSARTVISPDPNLSVEQVGVPMRVAMIMTYPETVSRYNIKKLKERIKNGPNVHPGANLIRMQDGFAKSLAFGDRDKAAKNLRFGDIVERHMEDGDAVLFNRQPSLHRNSIMAHRAKVLEWRTFRFNICVCAPYNADFDGDEMNMHLPQTEEARSEALLLLGVVNNLTTPRNGEPLVAASQDFLSASYLLTQKDRFFTRHQFCQIVSYLGDADEAIDFPFPTIIKPIELWTGKQIFGHVVRPNKECKVLVNFECKDKNYTKNKHFCRNDGWVAFRNSELISGNIAKKTIGDGSKTGLLFVMLREFGPKQAARIMDRWSRLCSRWMGGHRGFSIGISDVTPSEILRKLKHDILKEGFKKADHNIALYEKGALELRPGCDLLQSLEEILNGLLGRLRESAGQEAMKALPWSNTPRIMADCGSKGSPLNISQMAACVGQQAVGGMRIANGFANRTLPQFEVHSLSPSAKGFVANSFFTGLSATEFFFHAMGGREGLVDTAVKTAETGYMARRLMKALEDLSMQYDSSVRNSENTVVQFTYGDDGLNPDKMENNDRPVDFDRLRMQIRETSPCRDEKALMGQDLIGVVEERLLKKDFQQLLPTGKVFLQEVRDFFAGIVDKQHQLIGPDSKIKPEFYDKAFWNDCRITKTQAELILQAAVEKCTKAFVEPGDAVGAIGAQSISEPGTQMTLKTFHFSGISSMNVTLGVPRLKEIINGAKKISTPIITAKLEQDNNKVAARVVKAGIEKTTLGEVSKYMKEVYSPNCCYVSIELDMVAIEQLKLNVDASTVRTAILKGARGVTKQPVLRCLKEDQVLIKKGSNSKLRVMVPDVKMGKTTSLTYFAMQMLKTALPGVIVQGIPTVGRAVINETDKDGKSTYNLLVEGYGLQDVMGSPGIDGRHTCTNHVLEVEEVLGVEAARTQISSEISYIMSAYGIGIDSRHLLLLSDVMTFKGEVLGITRFGVSKMRESVLMLASFEKTTDHLFDAAVRARTDRVEGVSECIIMGMPVPIGSGLPTLFWKKQT